MQLAIIHHHLKRGGVTQVILNHLQALTTLASSDRPTRVAILYDGQRTGWPDTLQEKASAAPPSVTPRSDAPPFDVQLLDVPQLGYDTHERSDAPALAATLQQALESADCDPTETVVHAHNHALGKNASLPGALLHLATRGYRLLLQIHDFVEDFRPAGYRHLLRSLRTGSAAELARILYPQGSGVHYATLNSRDRDVLAHAGVPLERLHLLANPVSEFADIPPRDQARSRARDQLRLGANQNLVVYPVRGIRRKNVGEMVLHSALCEGATCHAITRAPTNPVEIPSFERWRSLAERLGLPCRFDVCGAGEVSFPDAVAASDAILTTSVAEGFGMVFLESCLMRRPLVGRNLPEITADFLEAGVRFPGLYDTLHAPLDWFERQRLKAELADLQRALYKDYAMPLPEDAADELVALLAAETIDFAALPGAHQAEVVEQVTRDGGARRQLMQLNHALGDRVRGAASTPDGARDVCDADELNQHNAQRVRRGFSPVAVGRRLAGAYRAVLNSEPTRTPEPISAGESILRYFLRADRVHPIRIEP